MSSTTVTCSDHETSPSEDDGEDQVTKLRRMNTPGLYSALTGSDHGQAQAKDEYTRYGMERVGGSADLLGADMDEDSDMDDDGMSLVSDEDIDLTHVHRVREPNSAAYEADDDDEETEDDDMDDDSDDAMILGDDEVFVRTQRPSGGFTGREASPDEAEGTSSGSPDHTPPENTRYTLSLLLNVLSR